MADTEPQAVAWRAFVAWCDSENYVPDSSAPHGVAFFGGYEAGAIEAERPTEGEER